MRIAVASEGLDVSPYFEHCTSFTFYTIDCGIIAECQNMPNPQLPSGSLASLLVELEVDVLIAGCIKRTSIHALMEADIEVVSGVVGTARAATEAYLAQTLIGCDEWCDYDDESDVEPQLAEA
ncbi:NifB/NifX family molybdenum-iron cluster-binding protein [Raoultibacter phocaeensis]|uniref:NifB/NifX family molybdenum-iron cluster-binding protein n=1 Tax=Raoultibacter phocaeensis TaxID=2479841 RepID=UPI00111B5F7B|nr:NifB/NifX family molybdenum-iron cluster-binding protein [Raoultibacter phocaeensis]